MHLSAPSVCCLCAASGSGIVLTEVNNELGKRENLQYLINKYIASHLLLPKSDQLCICDTCKSRLSSWNAFVVLCQKAQERLHKYAFSKTTNEKKQCMIDVSSVTPVQCTSQSSQKMKRSSNYCIARWCNKGNYRGVSLFRLPKDRDRALVWLSGAERLDLKHKQNLHSFYLCANHFTPNMFTNKACNQLIRKAQPTLFPRLPLSTRMGKAHTTSQLQPTQLRGVQLKNILPKSMPVGLSCNSTNLNENKSTSTVHSGSTKLLGVEILQFTEPEETLTIVSNSGVKRTVSKPTSVPNVLCVVNSASISCTPQTEDTSILFTNQEISHVPVTFPKEIRSIESNDILTNSLKFSVVSNLDDMPSTVADEESALPGKAISCKKSSEVSNMSNNSTYSDMEQLGIAEKKQKSFLESLDSSIINQIFNAASLLNVNDSFQESFAFRETKPQSCEKSEMPSKLDKMNTSEPAQVDEINQTSTVGSQDFLLPHVCELVDKQSRNFSVQSFPLKSENETTETACAISQKVSRDHSLTLHHAVDSKSPCTGLFDLQSDDIQGTEHSSYISGVDEFLDLDKYFQRR